MGMSLASFQSKLPGRNRGMKLNRTMQKQERIMKAIASLTLGAAPTCHRLGLRADAGHDGLKFE
jgi:hypothetical protein